MVILFVVGFAVGPGSIPWFFVTELFGQEARPTATAVAVVTNWSANFLVGLCFEPIKVLYYTDITSKFLYMQNFVEEARDLFWIPTPTQWRIRTSRY